MMYDLDMTPALIVVGIAALAAVYVLVRRPQPADRGVETTQAAAPR